MPGNEKRANAREGTGAEAPHTRAREQSRHTLGHARLGRARGVVVRCARTIGRVEHDSVDARELLEHLEAASEEQPIAHLVLGDEHVGPRGLAEVALLLDLGGELRDLGLDLVLEAQEGEHLAQLRRLLLGGEPARRLRHLQQREQQDDGEEDVATVREAPAPVNLGEADVGHRGDQDAKRCCELPQRRELAAHMLGRGLGDVDGHAHREHADTEAADEAPPPHHAHVDRAHLYRCTYYECERRREEARAAAVLVGHGWVEHRAKRCADAEEGVDQTLVHRLGVFTIQLGAIVGDPAKVNLEAVHAEGASRACDVIAKDEAAECSRHRDHHDDRLGARFWRAAFREERGLGGWHRHAQDAWSRASRTDHSSQASREERPISRKGELASSKLRRITPHVERALTTFSEKNHSRDHCWEDISFL